MIEDYGKSTNGNKIYQMRKKSKRREGVCFLYSERSERKWSQVLVAHKERPLMSTSGMGEVHGAVREP